MWRVHQDDFDAGHCHGGRKDTNSEDILIPGKWHYHKTKTFRLTGYGEYKNPLMWEYYITIIMNWIEVQQMAGDDERF